MKGRATKLSAWTLTVLCVFAVSGCGMVKDFRKNRHLKAAEGYVAAKKWKEATIEYRNALRFDPQNLDGREAARARVLRERAARRGVPAAAALPRPEPERPRGAPEARHDLPDGPRARQGARGGARDPGAAAARTSTRCCCWPSRPTRRRRSQDAISRLEKDRATLGDPDRVARALGVLYARNQDLPQGRGGVQEGRHLEARLARGAPGARAAAPRQAGARPSRRRSSRRRPTWRPPAPSRGCSSPTSTC